MATSIDTFVARVLAEFTVNGTGLLTSTEIETVAQDTIVVIASECGGGFEVVDAIYPAGPTVEPDVDGVYYQAWLELTRGSLYQRMEIKSASNIAFTSGGKSMSLNQQFDHWSKLAAEAYARYARLRDKLNPMAADGVSTMQDVGGLAIQGSDSEDVYDQIEDY